VPPARFTAHLSPGRFIAAAIPVHKALPNIPLPAPRVRRADCRQSHDDILPHIQAAVYNTVGLRCGRSINKRRPVLFCLDTESFRTIGRDMKHF
jgi:hypothetical protein